MAYLFRQLDRGSRAPSTRELDARVKALEAFHLDRPTALWTRIRSAEEDLLEWPSLDAGPSNLHWVQGAALDSFGAESNTLLGSMAYPQPGHGWLPVPPLLTSSHPDGVTLARNPHEDPCPMHRMLQVRAPTTPWALIPPQVANATYKSIYLHRLRGSVQFSTIWDGTREAQTEFQLVKDQQQRVRMFLLEVDMYKELELARLMEEAGSPLADFVPGSCPNVQDLFVTPSTVNLAPFGDGTTPALAKRHMCWCPETITSRFRQSLQFEKGETLTAADTATTDQNPAGQFPLARFNQGDALFTATKTMRQFKVLADEVFTIQRQSFDPTFAAGSGHNTSVSSNVSRVQWSEFSVDFDLHKSVKFPKVVEFSEGSDVLLALPGRFMHYLCFVSEKGHIRRQPRSIGESWADAEAITPDGVGGTFQQSTSDETSSQAAADLMVGIVTNNVANGTLYTTRQVPCTSTFMKYDMRLEYALVPETIADVEHAEYTRVERTRDDKVGRSDQRKSPAVIPGEALMNRMRQAVDDGTVLRAGRAAAGAFAVAKIVDHAMRGGGIATKYF